VRHQTSLSSILLNSASSRTISTARTISGSLFSVTSGSYNNDGYNKRQFQKGQLGLVHAVHFVRFNSTSSQNEENVGQVISPDSVAPASTDSVVSILTENVAPVLPDVANFGDLHALGLGSYYTPVGWLQNALEALHVGFDLPWWGAIAVATLVARATLFPLMVSQLGNTARLNNIRPQTERLTALLNQAQKTGNKVDQYRYTNELKAIFQKNNCSPFRSLLIPLVQMPIFISFFIGLRKMAELPVASMKTGGLLWFQDLTVADPYYVLPVLSAATFLLTIELGTEGINPQQQGQARNIFRFMAVAMVPLTYYFPSAVFAYWFSTNLFSLAQFSLFKIPGMKQRLGIPEMIQHPVDPNAKQEGLYARFQSSMNSRVEEGKEKDRLKQLEKERAARIAAGPPVIYSNKPPKQKKK